MVLPWFCTCNIGIPCCLEMFHGFRHYNTFVFFGHVVGVVHGNNMFFSMFNCIECGLEEKPVLHKNAVLKDCFLTHFSLKKCTL